MSSDWESAQEVRARSRQRMHIIIKFQPHYIRVFIILADKLMDNCTLACIEIQSHLDLDQMCDFSRLQCLQDTVPFIQGYYCLLHASFIFFALLALPLFYILFKILNSLTDSYLAPTVDQFILKFKISPALAGVTLLAFANGAPDVLTAIIAGSSDSDSTALIPFGSIFGACLFSTAFILSSVILKQPNQTLTVRKKQILIPLAFYIAAILYLVIVSVGYGQMNPYLACVPLVFYIIFIVIVITSERRQSQEQQLLQQNQTEGIQAESDADSLDKAETDQKQPTFSTRIDKKIDDLVQLFFSFIIPPFAGDAIKLGPTLVSLAVSPLFMAATQQMPDIFSSKIGAIPVMILLYIPSILLIIYVVACKVRETRPVMYCFTIYAFIITISVITLICAILINLMELVQLLTGINPVFLGLTVFAWANSIGDYLSITRFAKIGNPKTAVAGIFSGQLFNFLLGFGVSLFTRSLKGNYEFKIFDFEGNTYEKISDSIVVMVMAAGLVYLTMAFCAVIMQKGVLMKREALFARFFYFGFVMIIGVFLSILSDFFYEISCDM